eukprot:1846909-Pyramimonas_sp.AAC.1
MEGGPFSKCCSRFSTARIRLIVRQQLQGWRAGRFQNGALAVAPRTFVSKVCSSLEDGAQLVLFENEGLAVAPRTTVLTVTTVSGMERRSF